VLSMSANIGDQERHELSILITHFGVPAPIRPLDVFDMNYASSASIAGTILARRDYPIEYTMQC
jgi:hypothetical protein